MTIEQLMDQVHLMLDNMNHGGSISSLQALQQMLSELHLSLVTTTATRDDLYQTIDQVGRRLVGPIMKIATTNHCNRALDQVCIRLLDLLLSCEVNHPTTRGSDSKHPSLNYVFAYLDRHYRDILLQRWKNYPHEKFRTLVQPLVQSYEEKRRLLEIQLRDHIEDVLVKDIDLHEVQDEVDLSRYCLATSAIGVLTVQVPVRLSPIQAYTDVINAESSETNQARNLLFPSIPCPHNLLIERMKMLSRLHRQSKAALLELFPKGCGGCFVANMICAGVILRDSTSLHDRIPTGGNIVQFVFNILETIRNQHCTMDEKPKSINKKYQKITYYELSLDNVATLMDTARSSFLQNRAQTPFPDVGHCDQFESIFQERCMLLATYIFNKW